MIVETVQNISNISPLGNSVDSAKVKPEKTIFQQNEPIQKGTHRDGGLVILIEPDTAKHKYNA